MSFLHSLSFTHTYTDKGTERYWQVLKKDSSFPQTFFPLLIWTSLFTDVFPARESLGFACAQNLASATEDCADYPLEVLTEMMGKKTPPCPSNFSMISQAAQHLWKIHFPLSITSPNDSHVSMACPDSLLANSGSDAALSLCLSSFPLWQGLK